MNLSTLSWNIAMRGAVRGLLPCQTICGSIDALHQFAPSRGRLMSLSTLSWNIAAVNNNPFEYFLTHPDPKYISLMEGVEGFIEAPGEHSMKNTLP